MAIFDILAVPLGWLMSLIYSGIPNYFAAIFLFTLITRAILFPLSLKTQKSQADRARLAPRLERIKKKYEKDPKKVQEKQMALYEKEGVSLTGGCMPMIVQMLMLFGIISVIYSPLKHIARIPDVVINASVSAMTGTDKIAETEFKGYYKEMRVLNALDKYEPDVKAAIAALEGYDETSAQEYINEMKEFRGDFTVLGKNMLENPWGKNGFAGISVLWLIPLLSGLTAFLSSLLSMHYTKQASGESQPGQGCSNSMMLIMMPAFSLFITFSVPGGVGVYWICSNLIAVLQTYILNQIYNPAKIRRQAEIEYEERRRQKQEDKKRLAEARANEQRELALQQKQEKKPAPKKKKPEQKNTQEPAQQSAENKETATPETTDEP